MNISKVENSKRIAKNTLFLYFRMFFSMAVSIYTSRVILNTLGIEDYGIQNAVGGFLGMLGFLNASMAGATSRFITYALGLNSEIKLRNTFSTAVLIHIILAATIVLIAETIGLWFFEFKMIIPADRMTAALWVYQCAIITSALSILQTPYNAAIISHEKMNIFAYYEMLSVSLKLAIVFILLAFDSDRLILYSILLLLTSIIIFFLYRLYCYKHFPETKFSLFIDCSILKPMLKFSGWDLFGNISVVARTQGVSVLLNLFFGPILNASAGIATQIQGAVMGFASNIITAYRPQLIKQYAAKEYHYMFTLLGEAVRISTFLLIIITVPLICELNFVIRLWLGQVPNYVVPICRFTLIFNFFASISILLSAVIHATGRIKRISLYNGLLYILVVPIAYIIFKLGYLNPTFPYIINVVAIFLGVLNNIYCIKLYIPQFNLHRFIFGDYIIAILLFALVSIGVTAVSSFWEEGWIRLFMSIALTLIVMLSIGLSFYIPSQVRQSIITKLKTWI